MSVSEKLKALEASDESPATDMLIVWDVLPQIVAVVESVEVALEQDYGDGPPTMEIGRALAALDEALS